MYEQLAESISFVFAVRYPETNTRNLLRQKLVQSVTLHLVRHVRKIAENEYYIRVCLSVCLSVYPSFRMAQIGSQVKVKVIPQQTEVVQGVPGRLRPRIFLTFGTTRVVGRQPYASADFTPGEIHGTHFQRLSRPQGTWFRRAEPRKKSPVTPPGIDPGTVRLVAQCLNHYATPGPTNRLTLDFI